LGNLENADLFLWRRNMEKNDEKRLTNMLEAAKDAVGFLHDKTREDLDKDKQLTLSLLKSLEMIGEAASKVSKECQVGCEPIPWDSVIDLKQQVVHTYWDIDRDWIWKTVTDELPPIISALEQLVPSEAV
jgi:uncharacterized protein with HEPN domain